MNEQNSIHQASNDSEETANIATAAAGPNYNNMDIEPSSGNGSGGVAAPGKQLAASPNGHHDPQQRRIYLGLMLFSVGSALTGLGLIFLWMFKYRSVTGIGLTNAGQLSNLHPVLMFTFMVSLNMYAILVYRTHYKQPKERLKWTHAIISGVNIVMSLLGVLAMVKAHNMSNMPNFYSLHSWIGVLTNLFYFAQFSLGFIAFLKPGLAQRHRTALMPWHRKLGAAILVLASAAAITGIAELVIFQDKNGAYSKFEAITFIANFAGISVILMTGTAIYLVTASQYMRPSLAEEQPLKR